MFQPSLLYTAAAYLSLHPGECLKVSALAQRIDCNTYSLSSTLSTANKEGRLEKAGIERVGAYPSNMKYRARESTEAKNSVTKKLLEQKIANLREILSSHPNPVVAHELDGMELLLRQLPPL